MAGSRISEARSRGKRRGRRFFPLEQKLVQGVHIGPGGRHEGIGIGRLTVDAASVLLEPHRDFGLGVGSPCDGVNLVERQRRLVRNQGLDGVECGIDRTIAGRARGLAVTVDQQADVGLVRTTRAANDVQRLEHDPVAGAHHLIVHEGDDVLVENVLFLIGEVLESAEGVVERRVLDLVTEFLQFAAEGMTAGVFSHDQGRLRQTHRLGSHDLVGSRVLEHAVLVDAGLVGEGVGPDDRLVGLDDEAGDRRNQPRSLHDVLALDPGLPGEEVAAGPDGHDDLFHGRVAGPLAETVDRTLDLARADGDGGQGIGHRESEVVMAMHRYDRLVDVRHPVEQHRDEVGEFVRKGVTDRVGNVDGAGARLDRRLHRAAKEIVLGTRAVLRTPFDVVAQIAGMGDAVDDGVVNLVRRHLQFVLHMQGTGRNESVDALAGGWLQGFRGSVDVLAVGPGKAAHGSLGRSLGDFVDGLEITPRGDREPGFDDVDAHALQDFGDAQFFVQVHGGARRLLAVAQCGVEYDNAVAVGTCGHVTVPSLALTDLVITELPRTGATRPPFRGA